MASKAISSIALLLTLSILFFTLVSSSTVKPCPPPPPSPGCGCGTPTPPKAKSPPKVPSPPKAKSPPKVPSPPKAPSPPKGSTCPKDTLKLGVCADLLSGLVTIVVGTPAKSSSCCSLLQGLADLDAAVCLCTAIKANVLGIVLNVPVSLSLLLNYCGKSVPSGYQCS